jgi:hypothetical protein
VSRRQDVITSLLDTQQPHFFELMMLVDWVEQQRAIAQFGYPKDNAFPSEALSERLARREYIRALITTGEEGEEPPDALLDLLRELLNSSAP